MSYTYNNIITTRELIVNFCGNSLIIEILSIYQIQASCYAEVQRNDVGFCRKWKFNAPVKKMNLTFHTALDI